MNAPRQVPISSEEPIARIEAALVELRRHQQANRLQRRAARDSGPETPEEAASNHRRRPGGPDRVGLGHESHRGRGGHRGLAAGHARGALAGAARFRMLDALAAEPGQSVTSIAERVGVDQPRASRLIMGAVASGLVRRSPDPADARRWIIELTASGRAILEKAHESRRTAVVEATAEFTDEERRIFAELLTRFAAAWPAD